MKQEKPIHQPYEAPKNYFEDFNARVMQKIDAEKQEKSRVFLSFRRNYAYVAAIAAILILIGVGLYRGQSANEIPGNKIAESTKTNPQPNNQSTKSTITHEDAVIQQWVEETEKKPVVALNETRKNQEELSVEQELEAEGLIVMDVETAWLDENEILP